MKIKNCPNLMKESQTHIVSEKILATKYLAYHDATRVETKESGRMKRLAI
jgi:Arc/MetJ family transcription regulator